VYADLVLLATAVFRSHPLDSVNDDDLAQAISRALKPAHLSVWISQRD
jgi:hypothetical protein